MEVRWSHGRFAQPPEAKVYLDTPTDELPGYFPLERGTGPTRVVGLTSSELRSGVDLATTLEGATQGELVGVLEVAADGEPAGDAGHR